MYDTRRKEGNCIPHVHYLTALARDFLLDAFLICQVIQYLKLAMSNPSLG